MWRLVVLGPPGSGKSTQADQLCDQLGLAHLSTGELLRDEVARGTPVGLEAKEYMNKGLLVPANLVNHMVWVKLAAMGDRGFILDGYPRNINQADSLDATLLDLAMRLDAVVLVDIPEETAVERLGARLMCQDCRAIHRESALPAGAMTCPSCGGALIKRDDDKPEVIRERFRVYYSSIMPVLERFRGQGLLLEVDGRGMPDEVYQRLTSALVDKTGKVFA